MRAGHVAALLVLAAVGTGHAQSTGVECFHPAESSALPRCFATHDACARAATEARVAVGCRSWGALPACMVVRSGGAPVGIDCHQDAATCESMRAEAMVPGGRAERRGETLGPCVLVSLEP